MTAGSDSSYQPPALPIVTFSICFFSTPASCTACLIDSNANSPRLTSVLLPNLECPIPTMATSLNGSAYPRMSSLESMYFWTSDVPSMMSRILASRRYLSTGSSLLSPMPP